MAITGVNIYETRKYTSKRDPDTSNPTVFELGVLIPDLRAYIENKISTIEFSTKPKNQEPARGNMNITERNLLVCKFGIKGIENFIHPQTKKPIPFETTSVSIYGKNYNGLSDQILAMLGADLRLELAEEILKENNLTEDEAKNSS